MDDEGGETCSVRLLELLGLIAMRLDHEHTRNDA